MSGGKPVRVLEAPRNLESTTIPVLVGTPTLGMVPIEWHNAVQGLVSPTNWAVSTMTPRGYLVDDAQNLIVDMAMRNRGKWKAVLLLEDDTAPPPDLYIRLREHMRLKTAPLVSGLYHLKGSNPLEPLIYRGGGTGPAYPKPVDPKGWSPGELVWCDGVPTGCLLIDMEVLEVMWARAGEYDVPEASGPRRIRKVFEAPRMVFQDERSPFYEKLVGTSDLYFCQQIMTNGVLGETRSWKAFAKKKWPFVVDTSIRCQHIDRTTGKAW